MLALIETLAFGIFIIAIGCLLFFLALNVIDYTSRVIVYCIISLYNKIKLDKWIDYAKFNEDWDDMKRKS
jgi:hypothetical protein